MRFLRRTLFAAVGLGSLVGNAGCADSESMIFIRHVQVPVSNASGCTVDPDPTGLFFSSGVLDVAFSTQYSAELLVGSQLVARGNSSGLRLETARVQIQGAIVHVDDAGGNLAWGPTTVVGSGFIDPAVGSDATYGLTSTVLLGASLGTSLRAELRGERGRVRYFTSFVKVFGRTLGGASVETGEWQFPISVCYGCLVSFPPDSYLATPVAGGGLPPPNCDGIAATGSSVTSPCHPGQDDLIDCRLCKQTSADSAICNP